MAHNEDRGFGKFDAHRKDCKKEQRKTTLNLPI